MSGGGVVNEGLLEARQKRGWSLADMARATGLSKAYIHQLEQEKAEPSLRVAVKIAWVLGVSVHDLWPQPPNVGCENASNAPLGPLGQLTIEERVAVARIMLTGSGYSVTRDCR